MDDESSKRVSILAADFVMEMRALFLARMPGPLDGEATLEAHLAASIAVEAIREVMVKSYSQTWREVIFLAAEKLIKPQEPRPESKA